jgi:hypothetical protein
MDEIFLMPRSVKAGQIEPLLDLVEQAVLIRNQ